MAPRLYNAGVACALADLGLSKTAALPSFSDVTGEDHTLRNALVGAAGVSPFLGLIGQRGFKTSPYHGAVAPQMDVHKLMMEAMPGDIILTREAKPTLFRQIHEAVTGSPLHHVEPVIGKKDVYYGTTADVAEHATPAGQLESAAEQRARAATIGERAHQKGYKDITLLRPKTPVDVEALANRAMLESRKPYSITGALSGTLKDVFVPKIPGVTDRGLVCRGNTCATLTGEALRAGTGARVPVVPGKTVSELLPADFLRSGQFELVGHTSPLSAEAMQQLGRKATRRALLTRGALGLGLAGTAYGLSQEPDIAAGLAGAGLAPLAARRLFGEGKKYRAGRPLRHLLNVMHEATPEALAIKRNITRRTLPLMLGSGLLSYLAAKGIRRSSES